MRKYRNIKGNLQPKRILKYSEEWIEYRKKRGADSVKVEHCDVDTDGFHDAIVRDWRSPALKKTQTCIPPPPALGPSALSSSIAPPASGPESFSGEVIIPPAPTSGPQDLVAEIPEPMYSLVSFHDGYFSNMYNSSDGRWYPKDVDDKAIYIGEYSNNALYAFPLVDGARYTIVPETQASYFSNVSRGAGVGNNLWEWYWYKYTPDPGQPYTVTGTAANFVKYNSYANNPNLGTPKFSLYVSYPNVFLRDLQYCPTSRFPESEVMAIKASIEAGEGTGTSVGTFLTFNPNYSEDYRAHHSTYPPDPY